MKRVILLFTFELTLSNIWRRFQVYCKIPPPPVFYLKWPPNIPLWPPFCEKQPLNSMLQTPPPTPFDWLCFSSTLTKSSFEFGHQLNDWPTSHAGCNKSFTKCQYTTACAMVEDASIGGGTPILFPGTFFLLRFSLFPALSRTTNPFFYDALLGCTVSMQLVIPGF